MPCCKAKYYEWCKNLPVVDYKDEKGNEYCVFHAPQGKKGIPLEEFNKYVFEKIKSHKQSNEICDLSGTIFEGDINFAQHLSADSVPGISFLDVTFNGRLDFSEEYNYITFGGETYFTDVTFNGEANFSEVTFSKDAYFWGNTFAKGGDFSLLSIKEKLRFEKVNLEKVSFIDTDIRRIDFINCTWPKKGRRKVLYDELKLYDEEKSFQEKNKDLTTGWLGILKEKYEALKIYSYPENKQSI